MVPKRLLLWRNGLETKQDESFYPFPITLICLHRCFLFFLMNRFVWSFCRLTMSERKRPRLSVTSTTSTTTSTHTTTSTSTSTPAIRRPIPIRPWPIHHTLPITTSTTTTSITWPPPPPPPPSSSSFSHQLIYTTPTPSTGQISLTRFSTNPHQRLMTLRLHMPCATQTLHIYSVAIPIEFPPPPRPLSRTTSTQTTTQTTTEEEDKSTQTDTV